MSNELWLHSSSELIFRSTPTVKWSLQLFLAFLQTNVSYILLGGIKDITEFIDSAVLNEH